MGDYWAVKPPSTTSSAPVQKMVRDHVAPMLEGMTRPAG
jgi:hypothetical protein